MSDKDFKVKNKLQVKGITSAGPVVSDASGNLDSTAYVATQYGGTGTSTSPSSGQVLYSVSGTTYAPANFSSLPGVYARGNTASRPSSPIVGDLYYNTDNNYFESYTANGWFPIAAAPGIPTSVVATDVPSGRAYNNGKSSVAFSLSTSAGAPTSLVVTPTPATSPTTFTGSSSPILVTGLASSTSYTYTVSAISPYGTSAASSASAGVTATTVPQAPTIGTATTGAASATVSYTAGATGGASATYTATSSPGGFTGTGSSPITVSGLTDGTAYTFTVTATNANGTSTASSASNSVTPATGPVWGSWTLTTLNSGRNFPMTTFGNNINVAPQYYVPGSPAGNYGEAVAWTSTNGTSWTSRTLPSAQQWRTPLYTSSIWVIPTDGATYITSTDTITWTQRTYTARNGWGACAGAGYFAVAGYGEAAANVSSDGINWTTRTLTYAGAWRSAMYAANMLMIMPNGSSVYNTSTDGVSWTARSLPSSGGFYVHGWNGTVALAVNAGTTLAYTSTDGINWTTRTLPASTGTQQMVYSPSKGQFLYTIDGVVTAYTSPDGVTWTQRNMPTGAQGGGFLNSLAGSVMIAGMAHPTGQVASIPVT